MEHITGIYALRNKVNGRMYIGQSCDIYRRFGEHKKKGHEINKRLKEDYEKFGKETFELVILEECSFEELDEKEKQYINKLDPYYNLCRGENTCGRKGYRHSEETKEILRIKGKEQWASLSEEQKAERIKNNLKGPRKGHKMSEKTRDALRKAKIGSKDSDETRRKKSEGLKNSPKAKAHYERRKKPVICVETGVIYESVKDAQLQTGTKNLSKVCLGKQKSAKGFHFRFV